LTPDVLKTLKFGLRMHLNGGDKHSARVTGNDEYGLSWTRKTNGSPEYLIIEDILEVDGNPDIRVDMRAEDRDIEGFCRAYNEWRQSSPDADRRSATEIDVEAIIAASDKAKAERAEKMPDEQSAIHAMWEAYHRLEELGWRNAIYCPKDGTMFKAIEPGSTGIHDCMYQGEWPDGSWWTVWEGDMGPSRPILFKLNADVEAQSPEKRS
jgi:hypothetical protein